MMVKSEGTRFGILTFHILVCHLLVVAIVEPTWLGSLSTCEGGYSRRIVIYLQWVVSQ